RRQTLKNKALRGERRGCEPAAGRARKPVAAPATTRDRAAGVFLRSSKRTIVRRPQTVTGASHGVQQGAVEIPIDLLAQPADVNVDDVGLRVEMIVPDMFEQHRSGDDVAGIAHQIFEKAKFARQYLDRLVAAPHGSR